MFSCHACTSLCLLAWQTPATTPHQDAYEEETRRLREVVQALTPTESGAAELKAVVDKLLAANRAAIAERRRINAQACTHRSIIVSWYSNPTLTQPCGAPYSTAQEAQSTRKHQLGFKVHNAGLQATESGTLSGTDSCTPLVEGLGHATQVRGVLLCYAWHRKCSRR